MHLRFPHFPSCILDFWIVFIFPFFIIDSSLFTFSIFPFLPNSMAEIQNFCLFSEFLVWGFRLVSKTCLLEGNNEEKEEEEEECCSFVSII